MPNVFLAGSFFPLFPRYNLNAANLDLSCSKWIKSLNIVNKIVGFLPFFFGILPQRRSRMLTLQMSIERPETCWRQSPINFLYSFFPLLHCQKQWKLFRRPIFVWKKYYFNDLNKRCARYLIFSEVNNVTLRWSNTSWQLETIPLLIT